MAILIKADGTEALVCGEGKKGTLTLAQMRGAVGGGIAVIRSVSGQKMVVNKECQSNGKFPYVTDHPVNAEATSLYGRGILSGNVLLVEDREVE